MKAVIIGPTITGNKGASAMFESAVQTLSEIDPNASFSLLSYYPTADRAANPFDNVAVLSAKPIYLAGVILPVALLYGLLSRSGLPVAWLTRIAEIKALAEADVVLDQGGITFVDGREKYLPFNVACILPAIAMGRKLIKCSQAMGPFNNAINRLLAKWLLPKVDVIVARGERTKQYLDGLGLQNTVEAADYAFALEVGEVAKDVQHHLSHPIWQTDRKVVGVSPSSVIDNYFSNHDRDYVAIMADFIVDLILHKKYAVALIPHSVRLDTHKAKNNDIPVTKAIQRAVRARLGDVATQLMMIEDNLSAQSLRYLIGQCDYYVASRFHSMVSSLHMKVPTLVVGWSHKYKEVLQMFDLEDYAMGYEDMTAESLDKAFSKLISQETEIRDRLEAHLPDVVSSARQHVELIRQLV